MNDYRVIGIDLAKTKFHLAALDEKNKVVMKKAIKRKDFIENAGQIFASNQTFAFEACAGAHNIGQILVEMGHKVIALKAKDVKAYAKSRQKNDVNDAIAICKASLDPDLKQVSLKSKKEQEIAYFHKTRQNVIQQRIQRSNSIMSSLHEFGFITQCGKAKFAQKCKDIVSEAYERGYISQSIYQEMYKDCDEIEALLNREKELDKLIIAENKLSEKAQLLQTIPGIGPINASILSTKQMHTYEDAKDFAASLGLVPKQNSTGGNISLAGITKQGDRYTRTMLIQGARALVMNIYKGNHCKSDLYNWIVRLIEKSKKFNVICVAVANKLARIAYACVTKKTGYQSTKSPLVV